MQYVVGQWVCEDEWEYKLKTIYGVFYTIEKAKEYAEKMKCDCDPEEMNCYHDFYGVMEITSVA